MNERSGRSGKYKQTYDMSTGSGNEIAMAVKNNEI